MSILSYSCHYELVRCYKLSDIFDLFCDHNGHIIWIASEKLMQSWSRTALAVRDAIIRDNLLSIHRNKIIKLHNRAEIRFIVTIII